MSHMSNSQILLNKYLINFIVKKLSKKKLRRHINK